MRPPANPRQIRRIVVFSDRKQKRLNRRVIDWLAEGREAIRSRWTASARPHEIDVADSGEREALPNRRPDQSIGVGAQGLLAVASTDRPPGLVRDRVLDKSDRTVGEADVDAAGMVRARRKRIHVSAPTPGRRPEAGATRAARDSRWDRSGPRSSCRWGA